MEAQGANPLDEVEHLISRCLPEGWTVISLDYNLQVRSMFMSLEFIAIGDPKKKFDVEFLNLFQHATYNFSGTTGSITFKRVIHVDSFVKHLKELDQTIADRQTYEWFEGNGQK